MASCGKDLRNWLCFLFCVIVVGCIFPSIHTDSLAPHISYEIIIPRLLEPGEGKAKKEERSYIIKAAGKEHIIRLKQKNNFLVENLPVFTYDSEGGKVKSHPYIPAGCYYGGYVEGVADSRVALSTCFGLRGFLNIRDLNYGIEPLEGSRTFQHLLYLTNKTSLNSTVCDLRTEGPKHQEEEVGRGKSHAGFGNEPLFVELYIVVDNMMFRYEGGNETRVIHIVLDTVNMVYSHYHYLHIEVSLVGLAIWKERNLIEISSNGSDLSHNFIKWKIAQAGEVERDVTHLFIHQRFGKESWEEYARRICNPESSVGIVPYLNRNLFEFSRIVSHMLGHNIGIDHDGSHCFCDEQTSCIMHRFWAEFAMFSNCSVAYLAKLRRDHALDCLHNSPRSTFRFKGCGNKVVDAGEQCDCGRGQQCQTDPCCHPNCTFRAKAVCAHEECCQNCQIAPQGTLCRASVGPCDLPEYCTGKSKWCPVDTYKQDGTLCEEDAYCYAKRCLSHHLQCASIFGEDARAAAQSCFMTLNMAGDQVGNCGGDGEREKFVKCKAGNVLCGRLHCSNVRKKLNPSIYTQSLVNGVSCWSIKYQHGRPTSDRGDVPNGTMCGKDKVCMNRTCVKISIWKAECDPVQKCRNRGVCNNHHNCHCYAGWAPPDCRSFGGGGSIDSGSPLHAFTTQLFSFAFKVVIPIMLVAGAALILFGSKLSAFFSQLRQRISCWW